MADIEGDSSKQPPECKSEWIENKEKPFLSYLKKCPYLENTHSGYDSETYSCGLCGKYYKLYDDEMK